ncbi:MAG: FAD-dependent oxidoreductase [Caldilineaceae bacterium]
MRTKDPVKVVVLGGGYAGTLAALRLAGKTKGQSVEVLLLNGDDHFVERIRHHQLASGQKRPTLPYSQVLAGSNVRFRQGWCTAIHVPTKELVLQTPTGSETIAYDYLVYTLGSTINKDAMAGIVTDAATRVHIWATKPPCNGWQKSYHRWQPPMAVCSLSAVGLQA